MAYDGHTDLTQESLISKANTCEIVSTSSWYGPIMITIYSLVFPAEKSPKQPTIDCIG